MINVKPVPAIALLIIFSLLAWVAFGGGCKEKAEAIEPRIHWDEDTEGITITDSNFVMPEPNDYVTSAKNKQSIVEFVCPCGWKYTVMGYNLSYRKSFSIVMDFTEPNEPTKPKIPRLNKNHLLSEGLIGFELFIPTWPDYIELEKELVFDNRGEIRWYNDYRVIEKGTKIYFKD